MPLHSTHEAGHDAGARVSEIAGASSLEAIKF
jgi:hypothetical protein